VDDDATVAKVGADAGKRGGVVVDVAAAVNLSAERDECRDTARQGGSRASGRGRSDEPGGVGAGVVRDLAVLATQIADLAGGWGGGIAGGNLAALVGVKMCQSACAVAVGWDRERMDVVHYKHCQNTSSHWQSWASWLPGGLEGQRERTKGAAGAGKTGETDVKVHALASLYAMSDDGAADGGLVVVWKRGGVYAITGIVADDGGIA